MHRQMKKGEGRQGPARPRPGRRTYRGGKEARSAQAGKEGGGGKPSREGKGGGAQPGQKRAATQKVYLVKPDGSPVGVQVATGISDGGFVELVSGELKENDEVIVEQVTQGKKPGGMGSPMGPRF